MPPSTCGSEVFVNVSLWVHRPHVGRLLASLMAQPGVNNRRLGTLGEQRQLLRIWQSTISWPPASVICEFASALRMPVRAVCMLVVAHGMEPPILS